MNKLIKMATLTIALTMVLSACSGDNANNGGAAADDGNHVESGNGNNNSGVAGGDNSSNSDGGPVDGNDGSNDDSNGAGSDDGKPAEPTAPAGSTAAIVEQMIDAVEQPAQINLEPEMVQEWYHLDPTLLEEYTIRVPLMNVKTNEIALLKVKDAADVPTVQAAVEQRAADVQKLFESYLPDQYENAKNYKLIADGNYVLFIISESADELIAAYNDIAAQ